MENVTDIRIQTKTKNKQKYVEFRGSLIVSDHADAYILRENETIAFHKITEWITDFISGLQKNQKLELFIDSKKLGNIKNLELFDSDKHIKFKGTFLVPESIIESQPKTPTRTSLQIFSDKWLKRDNHVDLSAVILAIFERDNRMWQDYHILSDEEQKELYQYAADRIKERVKEL